MPTPANRDPRAGRPTAAGTQEQTAFRPRVEGDGRASPAATDARGLGDLVRELRDEATQLIRQEVALAKAEMREKVGIFQKNMTAMAVGTGLLLAAVLLLAWAVNMALTALLEGVVGVEVAVWLSPLVLAVLAGLVGLGMIRRAASALREEGVAPHETIETLKEDKRWAERKVKS